MNRGHSGAPNHTVEPAAHCCLPLFEKRTGVSIVWANRMKTDWSVATEVALVFSFSPTAPFTAPGGNVWDVALSIDIGRMLDDGCKMFISQQDVFLTEDKGGEKAWELKAEWARMYRENNKTLLEDIRVKVFIQNRKPIHITGESGELNNESKDIQIRGNVEVISEDGYTLRTEELKWLSEKREIVTEKAVWIAGKTFRLNGNGLRLKVDEQRFRLENKVKANFTPVAIKEWKNTEVEKN